MQHNVFSESESRAVARAAVKMAISTSREEERLLKEALRDQAVAVAAADFGGEFSISVEKIIERALSAARKEGLIAHTFREEGAVAGAAHEAVGQLLHKAMGLSVGGKIGIARKDDNIAVALFFCVGMMSLDEVCIGLGHRVL